MKASEVLNFSLSAARDSVITQIGFPAWNLEEALTTLFIFIFFIPKWKSIQPCDCMNGCRRPIVIFWSHINSSLHILIRFGKSSQGSEDGFRPPGPPEMFQHLGSFMTLPRSVVALLTVLPVLQHLCLLSNSHKINGGLYVARKLSCIRCFLFFCFN